MDECEVQGCPKQANLGGLCVFHRRKDIAGGLEYDGSIIWDLCAQGHRWTVENTHYENNGNGGKRRRCKQCLRDKAEKRLREDPVVQTPLPVRPRNGTEKLAHDTFNLASNELDAKCKGRYSEFTDYTAATVPSDVEAAKMCAGCPLMKACANAAIIERPGWGVRAGQVWLYGEPWSGDPRDFDPDD